jgi:hypothetical protein
MSGLRNSWVKFKMGEHLSDKEILCLTQQAENALPYLQDRLPDFFLPWKETITDLTRLYAYERARRAQNFKDNFYKSPSQEG